MLQWLIVIGLAYLFFRYSHVFKALDGKKESRPEIKDKDPAKKDDGEYIDYEEVD